MEFQERFATEEACRGFLFASRWPEGFVCPGCGGGRAGGETRRHQWVCMTCAQQASVTAGTVMHGTRQLQRQLGLSRYETAWLILQKLRRAMVAPEREPLKREVEVDEFFLGGREEGLRGGRQRAKKVLVGVVIEVRDHGSGRLRLQVLADASATSLLAFTQATTEPGAIVHTDGLQSYRVLARHGYDHRRRPQQTATPGEQLLPRAHRAVSNLKAWMHGTHRGVGDEHLSVYLHEYVFRHNRRGTPMAAFQTLLGLGALHGPTTYDENHQTGRLNPLGVNRIRTTTVVLESRVRRR